jgi:GntR family transcriptional regulator
MMRLDPRSPVPLYVQLAEAIRFEIATGAIARGSLLPALRSAAKRWGVNLHTVRRAYGVLAEKELVRTDPQRGTVVLGGRGGNPPDPVDAFVSRIVTEAHERHGLSVAELKLRLDRWGGAVAVGGERTVFVIERGESESAALATQLRAEWRVAAEGWSLERPSVPPPGLLLAPVQHYSELRRRWPDRNGGAALLETTPDPAIAARLVASPRHPARSIVCELDMPSARGAVADVQRILPPGRVDVVPHVVSRPGELLSFVPESVDTVLFPPRLWNALSAAERAHPKAVELRYRFEARDLERLAGDHGWSRR